MKLAHLEGRRKMTFFGQRSQRTKITLSSELGVLAASLNFLAFALIANAVLFFSLRSSNDEEISDMWILQELESNFDKSEAEQDMAYSQSNCERSFRKNDNEKIGNTTTGQIHRSLCRTALCHACLGNRRVDT